MTNLQTAILIPDKIYIPEEIDIIKLLQKKYQEYVKRMIQEKKSKEYINGNLQKKFGIIADSYYKKEILKAVLLEREIKFKTISLRLKAKNKLYYDEYALEEAFLVIHNYCSRNGRGNFHGTGL